MNALYRLLEGYDVLGREERFTADGLELTADFLETDVAQVSIAVRDATRGSGAVSEARDITISESARRVTNDP